MGGRSGTILLQSLFLQVTSNNKFKTEIESNIEFLVNKLESSYEVLTTFCTGLAGIGWLFTYLNEKGIIDIALDEYLEELDETIEEKLKEMLSEQDFDILHGANGLGLYLLKRKRTDLVERIILALDAAAANIGNETVWQRFDRHKLQEYIYDFGLAHGNASILYFLAKCYKAGVLPDTCKRLIRGGLHFFTNNIQDFEKVGSFYPGSKLVKEYKTNTQPYFCRLAWCYGDLGILHSLLQVSKWINDNAMELKIIDMLETVATRRADKQTHVRDAGFCHGASGVGYLFLNLYNTTGNKIFQDTAEFWVERTLQLAYHKTGVHGYLFHMGEHGWERMSDMLTGLAGVGAFYVQYLYKELNNDWAECFFLS